MASISSISNSSSIYGNRNIISGLASGLDTEALIENSVQGYKLKITGLQQRRTKVEWQQEAYRSIINKMSVFSDKYTSYTSSTNLFSASFFNNSVTVSSNGANKDKIAASGRTSSEVSIDRVLQMATAARYSVSGSQLGGTVNSDGMATATASGTLNLGGDATMSTLHNGSISLKYGSNNLSIKFDDTIYKDASELVAEINKQLESQNISLTGGGTKKASEMLKASVNDAGNVVLEDISSAKNSIQITSMSDNVKEAFGITTDLPDEGVTSTYELGKPTLSKEVSVSDTLQGEKMSITLDGVTKSINIPDKTAIEAYKESNPDVEDTEAFIEVLQGEIDKAFGTLANGKSKLEVDGVSTYDGVQLQFTAGQKGSTFSVKSDVGSVMGLDGTLSSYVDTGKTLGDVGVLDGLESVGVNTDGEELYSFELNGVEIGQYTKDTAIETIINDINSNSEAGVKASYSRTTNEFVFTARETGAGGRIDFGAGLASKMFEGGEEVQKGQDAIFEATVNGKTLELTRSSNTVDIDGLSVTLKGEFGYEAKTDENGNTIYDKVETEAVSFTSTADSDKIVDAIKSMIEDYNEMANEIKDAYSTLPEYRSNGETYEPLTDDDRDGMSESAIEAYEEKAKAGLLFGDRDLSSLYDRLRSAISMTGQAGADLSAIGITTSYSDGKTTLALDENKLRSVLASDPDKVRDVFTDEDGLMQRLKEPLDMYGKTVGTKGILVEKAGSVLAPVTLYNNILQTQLDEFDDQITSWQEKMNDKIDYYTSRFTQLEQLIAEMNSQSSALMGLMGTGA